MMPPAGWLYYIAGKTRDEIAAHMAISRRAAQRLVSLAMSERLIRVWMDHPIGPLPRPRPASREHRADPCRGGADRSRLRGRFVGLAEAGAAEIAAGCARTSRS